MNRIAFFGLFLCVFPRLMAQDSADYLTVLSNPLIEGILSTTKPLHAVYPDYEHNFTFGTHAIPFSEKNQELVKTPKHCYLLPINSGRVYRMESRTDSSIRFNRIDRTIAMYYNIGAYLFNIGEDLYSYGGYGFWKTNGALRKFNFKDGEWDVVPLSQEVIGGYFPIRLPWADIHGRQLFVPMQIIVNEGVKGAESFFGKVVRESMVLDLNTGQWRKLGRVSQKFLELYTNAVPHHIFYRNESGYLFNSKQEIYWIDFLHNRITRVEDPALKQSIVRFGGFISIKYMQQQTLYAYDLVNNKYDSLKVDPARLKGESFPIWVKPEQDYAIYSLLLALLVTGLYLYYRRHRNPPMSRESVSPNTETKNLFSEVELRLLGLFLEKSRAGTSATIDEINYVLGLRDKNLGIQKKIRSEVINGINQKFKVALQNPDLQVYSIRNESDKRYFEYYIPEQHVGFLQSLLTEDKPSQSP